MPPPKSKNYSSPTLPSPEPHDISHPTFWTSTIDTNSQEALPTKRGKRLTCSYNNEAVFVPHFPRICGWIFMLSFPTSAFETTVMTKAFSVSGRIIIALVACCPRWKKVALKLLYRRRYFSKHILRLTEIARSFLRNQSHHSRAMEDPNAVDGEHLLTSLACSSGIHLCNRCAVLKWQSLVGMKIMGNCGDISRSFFRLETFRNRNGGCYSLKSIYEAVIFLSVYPCKLSRRGIANLESEWRGEANARLRFPRCM